MLNMRGRNQPPSSPSLEAYAGTVEQILPAIGVDPAAARMNTEGGYGWSFQRGSAVIEVYVSQQDNAGYLQVLSPIIHLPMSNLLPLYRRLLELNLQLTAAAIGIHLDVVYVFSERPLEGMDAAEANTIINLVSAYADDLDDKLVSEFGGRLYAKVNG
jgi:type III secretion system-like peptide-binding chaperone